MGVYKDTLYENNIAEIWPKPTLFDYLRKNLTKAQNKKNGLHVFWKDYSVQNLWLMFLALLGYF